MLPLPAANYLIIYRCERSDWEYPLVFCNSQHTDQNKSIENTASVDSTILLQPQKLRRVVALMNFKKFNNFIELSALTY